MYQRNDVALPGIHTDSVAVEIPRIRVSSRFRAGAACWSIGRGEELSRLHVESVGKLDNDIEGRISADRSRPLM